MSIKIDFPKDQNTTVTVSCGIKAYVSKPIEKLRYTTQTDYKSIATNYFESSELNSSKNLKIEDYSISYSFNDKRNLDERKFKNLGAITKYFSPYKDVIFTYMVGAGQSNNEIVPLFYKQKKDANKNIVRVSVELKTNNTANQSVNYGNAIVDGEFYYNYQNEYDPITGDYKLYFLSISYDNGSSETVIINPIPAIEKADYNNLNKTRYTSLKRSNGYEYSILLPGDINLAAFKCGLEDNSNLNLYVKELEKNSIYLKAPENQSVENEWIVEITNGEVYQISENQIYKYSLPEYKKQPFSVEAPLLEVFDKDCYKVTEKIVKLPFAEVKHSPSQSIEIIIEEYDLNNEKIGEPKEIKSVDEKNGFVELTKNLNFDSDTYLRASFYYKTDTYYYNKINLNPYFNKEALKEKYHFYVKPNEDVEALVCLKQSELDSDTQDKSRWLYLGAVSYEEDYLIEDSFSFSLNNKLRYYSWEDVLKRNPYLLQSKYFYGENGQALQKNNIVVLELPAEYETSPEYSEKELYNLFKTKLKSSTNLLLDYYFDEPQLKITNYKKDEAEIECSWEGPGIYELLKKDDSGKYALIQSEEINSIEQGNDYSFKFNLDSNSLNDEDSFKIRYRSVEGKKEYSVKWE